MGVRWRTADGALTRFSVKEFGKKIPKGDGEGSCGV